MKKLLVILICMLTFASANAVDMKARQERKAITAGNAAYKEKKYQEALNQYNSALKTDPSNLTAQFNKGLALTRIAESIKGEAEAEVKKVEELYGEASQLFESVAKHTADNPALAARANFNRGNISFKNKDFEKAIDFYKNALRLNPKNEAARRNLRIAQQNLPKSNKNQDQNKNQDKDKKQDENKDKNQDQNQDQNKNQNKEQEQKKQQPQQKQDMNRQAADRLLKRSNDKENETRRQLMQGSPSGRRRGW